MYRKQNVAINISRIQILNIAIFSHYAASLYAFFVCVQGYTSIYKSISLQLHVFI